MRSISWYQWKNQSAGRPGGVLKWPDLTVAVPPNTAEVAWIESMAEGMVGSRHVTLTRWSTISDLGLIRQRVPGDAASSVSER